MKKAKIILIIITLILCTSCYKKEPDNVILSLLDEIEVYKDIMFNDLIADSNVEIISDNFKVINNNIGVNKYQIHYKYNNKKYKRDFQVNIVDNTTPFIYSSSNRTIYLNNNHDFCEELIFGDNYDSNPKCEIIGEYNNSIIGKYNIQMKVTDQSSNEITKDMVINVIEKTANSPTKQEERLDFSTVINNYKGANITYGIDVSSWQEDVNYKEVKNAGASFVMIRLGYQGRDTGKLNIDSYFQQNITNAVEAGLNVGIYLYTDSSSIKEAKEHAEWLLEILDNRKLDLPIAFDWEDFSKFRKHRISLYELNEMANIFIKTVNNGGYKGMIYSSRTYLENFWENKHDYPVWLAHYTKETTYEGKYLMWQLSNTGRIPGIDGPVDINIMYEANYE